jgi:transcriptional regulator with XRE-family HTH domain
LTAKSHTHAHTRGHARRLFIYAVVGARIKEERVRAKMTLEMLAEQAEIGRSFPAYIKTNGRKARLETIQRIAPALRIAPADLLREEKLISCAY